MDWSWIAIIAALVAVSTFWWMRRASGSGTPAVPTKLHIGDITLETLAFYCGYDYMKPILVAIKGRVFDVTNDYQQFGPGKPLHAYAGKEISRALALDSTSEADVGSDSPKGLQPEQEQRLEAALAEYAAKYDEVGQVVPLKDMTLEELALHDGSKDPSRPLCLAIQGVVFDVSKGASFYGPDGVYPFAGHECARALALMSTEVSDCNDKVDDLGYTERETLRDWTARFRQKYPVMGRIVPGQSKPSDAKDSS